MVPDTRSGVRLIPLDCQLSTVNCQLAMMYRVRFRSMQDAARAEQALDPIGGFTVLPGGVLAVDDTWLPKLGEVLEANGIEYRAEEVDEFTLGGRAADEFRD